MRLAPLLALTIGLTTHAFAEGEHQYVKLTSSGQGVILWTDRVAATNCARATLRGTEQDRRELCEDGTAGTKPEGGAARRGNRGGATQFAGVRRPDTGARARRRAHRRGWLHLGRRPDAHPTAVMGHPARDRGAGVAATG